MRRGRDTEESATRVGRTDYRRRRRKRRVVLGFMRLVFWSLVLAGVFVFGLGFGRTLGDGAGGESSQVTIEEDLGQVTSTLPTETVVQTKTVVQVKRAPKR